MAPLASETAANRATQARYMPDTCQVLRRTSTRDAFNEKVDAYEVVATVPCRIAALNVRGRGGETVSSAMVLTGTPQFELTVPYDTEVLDSDRIAHNGITYDVTDAGLAGTFATARRVMLQRIGRP